MQINVLAFGISRDILGGSEIQIDLPSDSTVADLLTHLRAQYPALTALRSLAVAVNTNYAEADQIIEANDEVVLIPPVAGG